MHIGAALSKSDTESNPQATPIRTLTQATYLSKHFTKLNYM